MKYFRNLPTEEDLINIYSDLKHRCFPRPFERLSKLRNNKSLVGVEIGVAAGLHAESLLKNLDIRKLYLVDPYEDYEDFFEGLDYYATTFSNFKKDAEYRLREYKDKIHWLNFKSSDAVEFITEELDFVYIDGNHSAKYVEMDLENYSKLVKKGGVLGGHDFYNGFARDHDDVINAVIEFSVSKNVQLQIELPDFWMDL